jgi:hypothetical protein
MLVRLTIKQFSARKLDRRVTREVNDQHGAVADAGRYNKRLLAKEALAEIAGIANAARAAHYEHTSPWLDDGARVLSAIGFPTYSSKLLAMRLHFEAAVPRFEAAYPSLRDGAAADLGDLFDPADYPDPQDIGKRFEFRTAVYPFPEGADFRVSLADGQAADIRAEIASAAEATIQVAMRDAWQRAYDVAAKMKERLTAYTPGGDGIKASGTFHDTLVSNVTELCDILPGLNLAQDPALDAIARRLREELGGFSAETLRANAGVRADTAAAADAILAHVQDYLN